MDGHIPTKDLPGLPTTSAEDIVKNLLNTTYTWAGIICVLIIVIAGIMYVTSSGDASRITKAKNAIFGAVIGLVIIILAFAITNFVIGRLS